MALRNQTYKVEFHSGSKIYVNLQKAFKLLEDPKVKSVTLVVE